MGVDFISPKADKVSAIAEWLVKLGAPDALTDIVSVLNWHQNRLPEQVRADFLSLAAIEYAEGLGPKPSPFREIVAGEVLRVTDRVHKRIMREAHRRRDRYDPWPEGGVDAIKTPDDPVMGEELIDQISKTLDSKEAAILSLLSQGKTQSEIADVFSVSRKTVYRTITVIREKLSPLLGDRE